MFQTELILWLQSVGSPALTWCMLAVSLLGYSPVYVTAILVLAFGVRLRPGLAVLAALLLTGILTQSLKSGFALPRPCMIDSRVVQPPSTDSVAVVERGGAPGFWSLPAADAVATVRALRDRSYGFPSGHVSAATAFLLAIALFFWSRTALAAAICWIALMSLSRMYLGRHFLADALGGIAVGIIGLGVAALLLRRCHGGAAVDRPRALAPLAGLGLVLAVLIPFAPSLDEENVGRLVGLAAAYGILLATGVPPDGGAIPRRLGRVAVAAALYLAVTWILGRLLGATGWDDVRLAAGAAAALVIVATLAGTIAVARRSGLCAVDPSTR